MLATETSTFGSSGVVLESSVIVSGTKGVALAFVSAADSSVVA
jgi:hypothetical protein